MSAWSSRGKTNECNTDFSNPAFGPVEKAAETTVLGLSLLRIQPVVFPS